MGSGEMMMMKEWVKMRVVVRVWGVGEWCLWLFFGEL